MAEFALVLPLFLLLSLGVIQFALIAVNAMMLNYTAYMAARTASVYGAAGVREQKAKRAYDILSFMNYYANGLMEPSKEKGFEGILSLGASIAANNMESRGLFGDDEPVKIESVSYRSASGNNEDGDEFIKVAVVYRMALTVPVVNKIFGLFQSEVKFGIKEILTGKIFKSSTADFVKYGINSRFPYYTLKAACVMRVL